MKEKSRVVFAGVIPYKIVNEEFLVLLGEEGDGDGWCGFGGGPEGDETSEETAIREGWEESMGLLGTKERIKISIESCKWVLIGDKKDGTKSIQYLIEAPDGIETSFNEVLKYLKYCNQGCFPKTGCYEKSQAKWFKLRDIITAAQNKRHIPGNPKWFLRRGFRKDILNGKLQSNIHH
jgi:hypothetical protein